MNNNKGFTLVEMLVVVAIIAILASVFLIGLRGFRGSAYDARRLSDLQKVQSYLELYYNKTRSYPVAADWSELEKILVGDGGVGVSSIPSDPVGGQTYSYSRCDDGQGYALGAVLSDPTAALMDDSETDLGGGCSPSITGCGDTVYCVRF